MEILLVFLGFFLGALWEKFWQRKERDDNDKSVLNHILVEVDFNHEKIKRNRRVLNKEIEGLNKGRMTDFICVPYRNRVGDFLSQGLPSTILKDNTLYSSLETLSINIDILNMLITDFHEFRNNNLGMDDFGDRLKKKLEMHIRDSEILESALNNSKEKVKSLL